MRYLNILLACLVFAGVGWGQASNFQRNFIKKDSLTIDSTAVDTFIVQLPQNRGKALPVFYLMLDDLDEDATHDSLLIQYKPFLGPSINDSLCSSGGAGITLTDLQIYNGPSGALTDFDNAITWVDSVYYMLVPDMDGYPWRYWWILLQQTANDCTTADDSIRAYLWVDVD